MFPVAKAKPSASGRDEKRPVGRPPTGVPTESLSCRAPESFTLAFALLSKVRGTKRGTELLRAAEEYLARMYWTVKHDPASKLLVTEHIQPFLEAVEKHFRDEGRAVPKFTD